MPASSAARTIASASAVVGAIGFWQITSAPAAAQAATRSAWVAGGVTMSTRSGDNSASIRRGSSNTSASGWCAATDVRALARSRSQTPTTRAPGIRLQASWWNWAK